uniref:Transposase-associated domain-containing protein n=1 Tax=Quercus lobata TaxID=97700 RepID=A0A7N2R7G5_QUELO
MNKSWMDKKRFSREYLQGVKNFIQFAIENGIRVDGKISYPCKKCSNVYYFEPPVVKDHLVRNGICIGYDPWFCHGESASVAISSRARSSEEEEDLNGECDNIRGMLHEMFPGHSQLMDEYGGSNALEEPIGEGSNAKQCEEEPNEDAKNFYDLLKDARKPLYEGCTKFSKLLAIIGLYHLKCLGGWSNNSFSLLLQMLIDMLPSSAELPNDAYSAKKLVKDLGLGYEKIAACPQGCMLFW